MYLRSLVPKTIPFTVFGTRVLKKWVLGPFGKAKAAKPLALVLDWLFGEEMGQAMGSPLKTFRGADLKFYGP